MAYKNGYKKGMSSKNKMSGMYYGKEQGNMMAHVENYQKPDKCYAQKYDQSPTNYIERQDYRLGHEASKLKGEAYHGRYDN